VRDGRPGVLVVTPLRLTGSDARVLVVRGWLPWSSDRARLPRVPVPEGPLEVSGTLDTWPGQAALPGAAPAEAFAGDTWPWLDAAALARRVGGVVHGFVLREGGADEGPLQRALALDEAVFANLESMVLPVVALALTEVPVYLRLLRGQAAARGQQNFISLARGMGLPTRKILFENALRPSSLNLITVVGINMGRLMGGAIIIETMFALPGIGQLLVESVYQQEYLMTQGIVLFVGVMFILINLLTDLVYALVDPRLLRDAGA